MTQRTSILKSAVIALGFGSLLAVPVQAGPRPDRQDSFAAQDVIPVQADCYSIGQRVAAQSGGTLARASLSNRGGRQVCVIVVVVPGKDGQRGRRQEIIVPAG